MSADINQLIPVGTALAVSGLLAAAGILLDRLVLPRQLRVMRVCLWRLWKRISAVHIPDIADKTIAMTSNVELS